MPPATRRESAPRCGCASSSFAERAVWLPRRLRPWVLLISLAAVLRPLAGSGVWFQFTDPARADYPVVEIDVASLQGRPHRGATIRVTLKSPSQHEAGFRFRSYQTAVWIDCAVGSLLPHQVTYYARERGAGATVGAESVLGRRQPTDGVLDSLGDVRGKLLRAMCAT
jgi:hypothetical protein